MEYIDIVNMSILGTKFNHPSVDMGKHINRALSTYIQSYVNGTQQDKAKEKFYRYFSKEISYYGLKLRDNLSKEASKRNLDTPLVLLDIFYKYGKEKLKSKNLLPSDKEDILMYCNKYERLVAYYSGDSSTISYTFPLDKVKDNVYISPTGINQMLLSQDRNVEKIAKLYYESLDFKKVFNFDSIENIQISKTATEVLSNVDNFELKDSIAGKILNGKVSLATDRGYPNMSDKKPQQDAILSISKSDTCFFNVVADGAGGMSKGEYASNRVIAGLKSWFDNISIDDLNLLDDEYITYLINEKLIEINNDIYRKYKDCCATVAFTLTIGNRTIIGNVGDSTVYGYDMDNDSLIEYTTLDSFSRGLSYDEVRKSPHNNIITSAIGIRYVEHGKKLIHHQVINNEGQHLIISSDGVTDLVSERTFKNFFRNKNNALEIVNEAVNRPDMSPEIKKYQDNVSAITVDLPNNSKGYGGRK